MNNFQVILHQILRIVLPVNLRNHRLLGDVVLNIITIFR